MLSILPLLFNIPTFKRFLDLSPLFSHLSALFFATEHLQPLSFQSLSHSFPCNGGVRTLSHLQDAPSLSLGPELETRQESAFHFVFTDHESRTTEHGPRITGHDAQSGQPRKAAATNDEERRAQRCCTPTRGQETQRGLNKAKSAHPGVAVTRDYRVR
jgi:hypothetical protein